MGINQGSFMAVQLFDSETASQLVSIARGVSFRKIKSLETQRGESVNRLTFPDIYGIGYSRISETDGVSLVTLTGSVRAGARRPQRKNLSRDLKN